MRRMLIFLGLACATATATAAPAPAQAQRDTATAGQDTMRLRLGAVIVSTTRTGRRIEDEPLRVEIVGREEIEEKLRMTPGDIAMLLNETGGVRVQTVAPAVGGAAVRIQGLRGRYAQVLSDGLPLYGEAAGLGPLQIPPMDLAQVEVLKGAASALYGGAALGGVINLISRRPDGAEDALLNVTSRSGVDFVTWYASEDDARTRWTLLLSANSQEKKDVDGDNWADLPGYSRGLARPRLYLGNDSASLMLTTGVMYESRTGGDVRGQTPFPELLLPRPRLELKTMRVDAGAVGNSWWRGMRVSGRASWMSQRHEHRFTDRLEDDRHYALFTELALSGNAGDHTWVAGAALHHDGYAGIRAFNERATTPGVFVQDEWHPSEQLALAASARVDRPGDHGVQFSPRLSLLLRPTEWSVRLSAGGGHHVPSHWIEEVEAIGLGALAQPNELRVERARSASLDVGRDVGPFEFNVNGFASRIRDAVALRGSGTSAPEVINVPGTTRTWGGELLARAELEPVHATFSYAYVRATEPDPDNATERRSVGLTPRHTAGLVVALEDEERGRVGFELYYTGRQSLHDNPYRNTSTPYVLFGVLAERRFGRARLFINFENITNVRQSKYQPLLLPARSPDGRWTTDAWAPLEGRVINGGLRLALRH